MRKTDATYEAVVNVRLNPRIKGILKKIATGNGLTLSEYIRQLIYQDLRAKTITATLTQSVKEEIGGHVKREMAVTP